MAVSRCHHKDNINIILVNSIRGANDLDGPWMAMYSYSLQFLHRIRPRDMPIPPWKPANRASPMKQFKLSKACSLEECEGLYHILETIPGSMPPQCKYLCRAQLVIALTTPPYLTITLLISLTTAARSSECKKVSWLHTTSNPPPFPSPSSLFSSPKSNSSNLPSITLTNPPTPSRPLNIRFRLFSTSLTFTQQTLQPYVLARKRAAPRSRTRVLGVGGGCDEGGHEGDCAVGCFGYG